MEIKTINIMKQELLQKIQKFFLTLTIILLPFTNLPKKITFSSIGPNIVHYIIIVSLILFFYEYYKYKFHINKIIFYFFIVYIISQFISLLHGLYTYPYYDLLTVKQLPKLQYLVDKFNISISNDILIAIWLFIRETKNIILDSVYLCVIPLIFIHLFDKNKEEVFSFVEKAVVFLVCLLGLYSIPEIIYLKFENSFAKNILETINPFLYDVAHTHAWWPPLLWDANGGQLRSLCPEPPFFCIIAIFCIPFLFRLIYNKFSFKYIALFSYFIFMLFMSKSRTGLIIFSIELFILFIFLIFNCNKKNLYFMAVLLFCMCFSMTLNLYCPSKTVNKGNETLKDYVYDNVISGVKLNERTNNARLANIVMLFEIGIKKPVLGVGRGLKDAYMLYNIPDFAKNDFEVNLWQKLFKQNGLKSIFPVLNQYVYVFAERGVVGLTIFLFPIIYIFYCAYKNRFLLNNFNFMILLIIFIGQLFAMLTEPYFITYSISLGLIFLYLNNNEKKENNSKIILKDVRED